MCTSEFADWSSLRVTVGSSSFWVAAAGRSEADALIIAGNTKATRERRSARDSISARGAELLYWALLRLRETPNMITKHSCSTSKWVEISWLFCERDTGREREINSWILALFYKRSGSSGICRWRWTPGGSWSFIAATKQLTGTDGVQVSQLHGCASRHGCCCMRSMELDSSTGWLRSVCRLPICSCLLAIVSKKLASSLFMMKLQQQQDAR